MFQSEPFQCEDTIAENIYEKWLRRRMDYAIIRETGNHTAPGFVHTILHSGNSPNAVTSEVREEMWKNNKYPHSRFFQHGQVLYRYPPYIKEILDLRFFNSPLQQERCSFNPELTSNVYSLSLKEVATVPNWIGPLIINPCPYPHTRETPETWTLGEKPTITGIRPCRDPSRVNTRTFPACRYKHDVTSSKVYCQDPLLETSYIPGPSGRSMAHFKGRLNHPEGKRDTTFSGKRIDGPKKPKDNKCLDPCSICQYKTQVPKNNQLRCYW